MFLFCLVFAMFCARLFICASWSPAGIWDVGPKACSNDDPQLTLTYLTSRSSSLPGAFKEKIFEKLII